VAFNFLLLQKPKQKKDIQNKREMERERQISQSRSEQNRFKESNMSFALDDRTCMCKEQKQRRVH